MNRDPNSKHSVLDPMSTKSFWVGFDAGKDWGQEDKAAAEDEMAGWHQ